MKDENGCKNEGKWLEEQNQGRSLVWNTDFKDQALLAGFQQLQGKQKKLAMGYVQGLLIAAFAAGTGRDEQDAKAGESDMLDQEFLADFHNLPGNLKKTAAAYIHGIAFSETARGK